MYSSVGVVGGGVVPGFGGIMVVLRLENIG